MSVKTLLYQVRDEQREINELEELIAAIVYPSGTRYDRDRVQGPTGDPTPELAEELGKYRAELSERRAELVRRRTAATRLIYRLPNSTKRQILIVYFLDADRPRMAEVARRVGYSPSRTYELYRDALRDLEKSVVNRKGKCDNV